MVSLAWDRASLCLVSWSHYEQCPSSLYKCPGLIISDIFILLLGDETHHFKDFKHQGDRVRVQVGEMTQEAGERMAGQAT